MDKFHVGQRVRFKGIHFPGGDRVWCGRPVPVIPSYEHGTITSPLGPGWCVLFDVTRSPHPSGEYACYPFQIEPIPDDAAFHRFMSHTLEPIKETA